MGRVENLKNAKGVKKLLTKKIMAKLTRKEFAALCHTNQQVINTLDNANLVL
jgi:nitrate/TMAO reductase-like tetraheme cytochrome c subunit